MDFNRRTFGPLSFWCLNHRLEKDEISRQLRELKEKGFSGFFMHPRAGLLTPYGSEEWFDAVGFSIRCAKRLGLEAWLYDEDPFPSGMAGGRVVLDHPEYKASALQYRILDAPRPGRYDLDLPEGAFVAAFLVQGGKIRRIDECVGMVRTEWGSTFYGHSYYPPYTADGNPHWRAGTGNPRFRLAVEIPRGRATLIGFTRHSPFGSTPDLMNPEAVSYFMELTHRAYHRRFGNEFGRTIPGIFTDEPKTPGELPWSDHLSRFFHAITGRELTDCLPHLAFDIGKDSLFFRWAYREAVSRAFKAAFIDPIERYCERTRLAFTGHLSPEEDPLGQAHMTPGLMNWIGAMAIPGCDLIGAGSGDQRHPLLHLGPKLASSAAHTRGKTHVLCEAFAVVDWVQDTAFMGEAINWLYALGVNVLTTHGQFYSIDGLRKREAPPSQFFQASYWEHFGALSRYVESLSRALTAGRHHAPLLIYYPSEAFLALTTPQDPYFASHGPAHDLRDRLAQLMDLLLTNGYDFDLVDAEALSTARVARGGVGIQDETYRAIIIPGGPLHADAVRRLRELERRGVKLLALAAPLDVIGGSRFKPKRSVRTDKLIRTLRTICQPVFEAKGRLIGHKRVTPEGEQLFLVNNGERVFAGEVKLDFPGPYQVKDLQTGTVEAVGMNLAVELEPGRGVLVQHIRRAPTVRAHLRTSDWHAWQDISDGWTVRPESDNCVILNAARVLALPDEATETALREKLKMPELLATKPLVDFLSPDAALAGKHLGRHTLFQMSFDWSGRRIPLYLVRDSQLGQPADRERSDSFRFFLNGREIADFERCRRYDPYNLQARIDPYLRQGRDFLVMTQSLPKEVAPAEGMPFDAVRLFGAFEVEFPYGFSSLPALRPRPSEYRMGRLGTAQELGHPQYGGILVYSRDVRVTRAPVRTAIGFSRLHESAEIRVNGKPAGILWQPPSLLEIPAKLWRTGKNRLEVRCSSSPANYLQDLRRPAGFSGAVKLLGV